METTSHAATCREQSIEQASTRQDSGCLLPFQDRCRFNKNDKVFVDFTLFCQFGVVFLLKLPETAVFLLVILVPIDTALHLEGNCPVAALQKISWTLLRGKSANPGAFKQEVLVSGLSILK